jgi:integrase
LPLKIKGIQKLFMKYAKLAGLDEFTSHSLRKGCTTRLIKNDANIYLVQKFLGHASLNTIQYYAKLDVEDLRKIIEL